jgi:predicted nuclease of restriction endonuclease-like (RecB) superfamily
MTQPINQINENSLFSKVAELLELARKQVVTTVNLTMVHTYFEIGKMIIEEEQQGEIRATYGKGILKDLSNRLKERFGKGFSVDNLQNMRRFYSVYSKYEKPSSIFKTKDILSNSIPKKPSSELQNTNNQTDSIRQKPSSELQNTDNQSNSIWQKPSAKFKLSWSHYLVLMRIENSNERSFYEIEAFEQNWSEPQLKRQYHSSLYERLALSRDKNEVMKLATEGQKIDKPQDLLKNPLTLDFLGLQEKHSYTESDLEHGIISKLQDFLLELGKGFLFEARQKRFTFDNDHYFVDLVFYNRLLQCYVIIDLKTEKLVHQDLGQMQMYVNYYDRFEKLEHEKPTIGILLCKKKNDALVELTLPKNSNIYASEYSLYLPEKELLQQKLIEWIQEFEEENL